jgi:hypothetical protein
MSGDILTSCVCSTGVGIRKKELVDQKLCKLFFVGIRAGTDISIVSPYVQTEVCRDGYARETKMDNMPYRSGDIKAGKELA